MKTKPTKYPFPARFLLPEFNLMLGIRTFSKHLYEHAKKSGFYSGPFNDAEKIALMHSELSEALEGLRRDCMDDHLPHRTMVEVELADAVIRIMNYCTHRHLDLAGAIVEKARYNTTRPRRHGGKKF